MSGFERLESWTSAIENVPKALFFALFGTHFHKEGGQVKQLVAVVFLTMLIANIA